MNPQREVQSMTAHLLILYPVPKDTKKFDRAYREEHLPYAGPKLVGATGVTQAGGWAGLCAAALSLDFRRQLPVARRAQDLRDLRGRQAGPGARRLDQLRR